MTMLWPIEELVAATGGRPAGRMPDGVTGISIDSRTAAPGDAFFAIRGDKFDGHDFIAAAMRAGAALAVVSEERLVALGALRLPLVVVSDVLEALRRLGVAARVRSKARIAAITGSAGKTSTKEMARVALSACGATHGSASSHNNHWGVPLSLARLPADAAFGVFEIGMNHAGEIAPLVAMVRPHAALVTLIAPAHMGAFSSLADIARAKAEIFSAVEPGGIAILNAEDRQTPLLAELAAAAGIGDCRRFGRRPSAEYRLARARNASGGMVVNARIGGKPVTYAIGAQGSHMALNSVAALAVAHALGADTEKAAAALAGAGAQMGRGMRHALQHRGGAITLIDESYNANPASMEAAIAALAATRVTGQGRRIAVLGDMLELGAHSARLHKGLARALKIRDIDRVFLAGEEMRALASVLPKAMLGGHFADAAAAGKAVAAALRGGDAVMVKASNGLKFASIVELLKQTFPETANAA
jgi:UDP-N-acetylmuramoyl-tripeptide--D-alanyl-D-alanine ligase